RRHQPTMRFLLLLATLLAIVLSCMYSFDTWLDGRCFRMSYQSDVSFQDALSRCQGGMNLPIVRSAEENEQFFSALTQQNAFVSFSFWLGLSCSESGFVWADGTEATYTNFAEKYACDSTESAHRYFVGSDHLWYVSKEGKDNGVNNIVCEAAERSDSACDWFSLFQSGKSADICYKIGQNPMTWSEAEEDCLEMGSHLSAIHDQEMNDFLSSTALSKGMHDGVHIGMQENFSNGNYSWSDGSNFNYNNFVPGFPNDAYGNCVAMQTDFLPGEWMNVPCYNTRLPYVCTKPAFAVTNPQPAGCPVKKQYAPGDEMFSPSFPDSPGVSSCDYLLLEPDQNKQAEVTISFFESNTCCDSLTVYDGLFGSNILAIITGYHPTPVTVRAASNAIRLHWNATSGGHVRGFHATMGSCC
ncbi:hypothetical protein PMAYCL1PPCAC_16284, partial [Pristionchus mayeri]